MQLHDFAFEGTFSSMYFYNMSAAEHVKLIRMTVQLPDIFYRLHYL